MQRDPTDHRVRVTRMLIRKAFVELLRQKPIQNVSIRELCERAGINRSTFYAHYPDLYALLEDLENEMLADFEKSLEPLLQAQGEDLTPLKATTNVLRCLKDNADLCAVMLGPYGDKEFSAKVIRIGRERCIETYAASFPGASRRQLEGFYTFVSAGCIALLEKWLADGMPIPVDELAAIAESIMMQGIGFLKKT